MVTRRKEEPNSNGHNKGKIKFRYMDSERVVDFSVENMTGDSVTDGLHSIANALAGRTLPRGGTSNPKHALAGTTVDVEEEVEIPEDETPEEEVLEPEIEEADEDGAPKPKKFPKVPK